MTRNINFVGVGSSKINQRTDLSASDLIPRLVEFTDNISVDGATSSLAYGSWTEVIASTGYDTTYLSINASNMALSGFNTSALIDIALGASGSENIIISSIPCGYAYNVSGLSGLNGINSFFPIYIPKGSRISVRLLTFNANDSINLSFGLFQDITGRSPNFLDTYGADTTNARGTNLPTSNTYVQITSSTTRPYKALIMMPAIGGATSITTERSIYTLAIGSAGNEIAIGTMSSAISVFEQTWTPICGPVGIYQGSFPIGTRIACKQSIGRTYRDVIVYGVPYA